MHSIKTDFKPLFLCRQVGLFAISNNKEEKKHQVRSALIYHIKNSGNTFLSKKYFINTRIHTDTVIPQTGDLFEPLW